MSEWQSLLQSILIGLIFSYLLAKLISLVVTFKEDNLSITRQSDASVEVVHHPKKKTTVVGGAPNPRGPEAAHDRHETESMIAEQGSVRNESLPCSDIDDDDEDDSSDDDDDWEGVESTELDEIFSAATAFVAASAAASSSQKVSTDHQLQLYALYKIATEGPCSAPQPSALKMTARAKWQAWQKLGAMPPEEAMQKYIDVVSELFPTWLDGSSLKRRGGDDDAPKTDSKGPMGPVFSSLAYEEESGNELKMEAIHAFAREGEANNLLKCIDSGVSVNMRDSEGRTPLHWAVDRGHFHITEVLLSRKSDVNAKDNEGQTPLHYAVVCERETLAKFLVKQNADLDLRDDDGKSPRDLCESDWPWMKQPGSTD
ncbi:hypothetical protein Dsin_001514 [Dipteronia sinensis]|uniref:ACB domain-containing protein n=1 Tax=Dipteronia sinensis TaxID=43782 RepID=A0AAE0B451_9ROSI|nr:hypothetical protein Dsin_001514 [Dipteronia sinensis]